MTNVISQHKGRALGKPLYTRRPDDSLEKKKLTLNVQEEVIIALFYQY